MRILLCVALLSAFCVTAYAADVDGSWTGSVTTPQGEIPVSFKFKAEGSALTGTTLGLDGAEVQIKDGKIDGNTITFTVTFDFGGMPFVLSYKGEVGSGQIKMTADALGMPLEFVLKKG
jgi:hypothetical protein